MYCPKNGRYSGEIVENAISKELGDDWTDGEVRVLLEIHESPGCAISQKVLDGTDTAGTVVSVGSTVALIAGIIPGIAISPAFLTTAAAGGVAVGLYSIVRSIGTLIDRGIHDQSVGLVDSESRACWLNATVAALGAGSSAATGLLSKAASNGTRIGLGTRAAYNTLHVVTIVGSAGNLINCGYGMYEKINNKEKITPLEIFQFSTSILFLYKSSVGFKTAKTIISETQQLTLQNYEQTLRSNRHRRIFKKAQLEAKRLFGDNKGNAEVISGIRNINDPDNFFAGLVRMNKDFNNSGARFTITPEGQVQINSVHIVDPVEFSSLATVERVEFLNSLPPPQATITVENFTMSKTVVYNWFQNLSFRDQISGLALSIATEILKNGCDIDSITLLVQNFADDVKNSLLNLFINFLKSVRDVIAHNFKELFPFVSLPTGVMQFLINIATEIADNLNLPLSDYLKTGFNHDGTINDRFIYMLVEKLEDWIVTKLQILQNNAVQATPFVNGFKVPNSCSDCGGYYFMTQKSQL